MKYDRSITWNPVHPDTLSLSDLNVAVVGGTGGIGRALSRFLASRGARVTVVGRTFRDVDAPGITFVPADLSLMREAARVADELAAETLDLLVLTTGIFAAPQRQETAEGLERDMAVSYLSRLVILRRTAARLGANRPQNNIKPRVFVMGYPGSGKTGSYDDLNAEKSYKGMDVHMNTVAGNEILVLDTARRHLGLDAFGLNPGFIKSGIRANLLGEGSLRHRALETSLGLVTPSAETYARRIAPLLVSPDLTGRSGALFNNKGRAIQPTDGLTPQHIKGFINASEQLVATVDDDRQPW